MPQINPANEEALELINTIGWGLFDSMGGVNFQAIYAGFKLLEIPEERRRALIDKIGTYVKVVREHQEAQDDKPDKPKYMRR